MFSNTAFTFLPILIAVSAARVFGGNIFLGAVIGMIMIHPNLINAWSVASMDAADIPVWHLLGLPIRQVGYQGHVIPVIIAVWIMCKLENWLHRHVPEMIDLFVTPLCTVLLTGFSYHRTDRTGIFCGRNLCACVCILDHHRRTWNRGHDHGCGLSAHSSMRYPSYVQCHRSRSACL